MSLQGCDAILWRCFSAWPPSLTLPSLLVDISLGSQRGKNKSTENKVNCLLNKKPFPSAQSQGVEALGVRCHQWVDILRSQGSRDGGKEMWRHRLALWDLGLLLSFDQS
jgi:hypothetical protein